MRDWISVFRELRTVFKPMRTLRASFQTWRTRTLTWTAEIQRDLTGISTLLEIGSALYIF